MVATGKSQISIINITYTGHIPADICGYELILDGVVDRIIWVTH